MAFVLWNLYSGGQRSSYFVLSANCQPSDLVTWHDWDVLPTYLLCVHDDHKCPRLQWSVDKRCLHARRSQANRKENVKASEMCTPCTTFELLVSFSVCVCVCVRTGYTMHWFVTYVASVGVEVLAKRRGQVNRFAFDLLLLVDSHVHMCVPSF